MSTTENRRAGRTAVADGKSAKAGATPTSGRIPEPRAISVRIDEERLWVEADDGRQLGVPLARFPRLANATPEQRANWRMLGRGIGIHWPDVDEDISVARLFGSPTD